MLSLHIFSANKLSLIHLGKNSRTITNVFLKNSCSTFCQSNRIPAGTVTTQRRALLSDLIPQTRVTLVRYHFHEAKKPKLENDKNWNDKKGSSKSNKEKNLTTLLYLVSLAVLTTGASYAAVPLYRIFCQSSGYGGTTKVGHDTEKVESMTPNKERLIKVIFTADTAATMRWNFRPQQSHVDLYPGETALAFYTAKNPTDSPIDGISTYNVVPFDAGQYFNKIQCFCFEEQRLNPNEEVDMPVFFYIDPDFLDDPFMEKVDTIYLSYTFFESKPGFVMPMRPG